MSIIETPRGRDDDDEPVDHLFNSIMGPDSVSHSKEKRRIVLSARVDEMRNIIAGGSVLCHWCYLLLQCLIAMAD
jgi:hypothetical protein